MQQDSVTPIVDAGLHEIVKMDATIISEPGLTISLLPTPGHTIKVHLSWLRNRAPCKPHFVLIRYFCACFEVSVRILCLHPFLPEVSEHVIIRDECTDV